MCVFVCHEPLSCLTKEPLTMAPNSRTIFAIRFVIISIGSLQHSSHYQGDTTVHTILIMLRGAVSGTWSTIIITFIIRYNYNTYWHYAAALLSSVLSAVHIASTNLNAINF